MSKQDTNPQRRVIGVKADTSMGAKKAKGALAQKCGDCLFFSREISPVFSEPCKDRGVKEYASAPSCFSPNVRELNNLGSDFFALLGSMLSVCSPRQTRLLSHVISQQHHISKLGFYLMQPVYFRLGEDYLDNYFKGFILSISSTGGLMLCSNPYLQGGAPLYAEICKESVLTESMMEEKREQLIASGRLYEPKRPQRNTSVEEDGYIIPTMEMSEDFLEQLQANQSGTNSKKKGRSSTRSAVERKQSTREDGKTYSVIDVDSVLSGSYDEDEE